MIGPEIRRLSSQDIPTSVTIYGTGAAHDNYTVWRFSSSFFGVGRVGNEGSVLLALALLHLSNGVGKNPGRRTQFE